jgi:hypothetical protein
MVVFLYTKPRGLGQRFKWEWFPTMGEAVRAQEGESEGKEHEQ